MGTHTHFLHGGHLGSFRKQSIAGIGVAALMALALYQAILKWRSDGVDGGLIMLGLFAGPAVMYAFGYFWCVPESLGGVSSDSQRTLHQRWVDLGLLGTFFAVVVIGLSYWRVIQLNWSYVTFPRALSLVIISCWILPCCVLAGEKYLGWTMLAGVRGVSSGWRASARRIMRVLGTWPVKLGPSSATLLGGMLILLSLVLGLSGDIFGPQHTGYQVLINAESETWGPYSSPVWPTNHTLDVRALAIAYRGIYALSLLVAVLAMVNVALTRYGRKVWGNRLLAGFAAMVVLLEVTALASTLQAEFMGKWVVVPWIACWAIPITMWIVKAKGGAEGDQVRIAIMVFYLPLFMIASAIVVFFSYFAMGYGAFLLGMLILWWGQMQGNHEAMHTEQAQRAV